MKRSVLVALATLLACGVAAAQQRRPKRDPFPLPYPPELPGGAAVLTERTDRFLEPSPALREGVEIAKTAPTVDFLYYPGQDHPGKPWSVWGDGVAAGDRYYSAIGDHLSPKGSARIYAYDAGTRTLRQLVDLREFLESSGAIPEGMNYVPAKVHSRIDLGSDGWLYYATHRGSPRTTDDAHGYRGDWIFRTDPESGKTEIVATHPVPKHAIPMSALDPERMIFYGGTASGKDAEIQDVCFFAFDVRKRKLLFSAPGGPKRCAIRSASTGCLYWNGKKWDPARPGEIGTSNAPEVRSATTETADGIVYGTTGRSADLWAYDVKNDTLTPLGPGAVAGSEYTTAIDVDPTGRYLYYVPGGHGGGVKDGTPIVQFDVKRRKRKVVAFLHDVFWEKARYHLDGTFSIALSPDGSRLYVTWNGMREGQPRGWESCAMTAIHIPAEERP